MMNSQTKSCFTNKFAPVFVLIGTYLFLNLTAPLAVLAHPSSFQPQNIGRAEQPATVHSSTQNSHASASLPTAQHNQKETSTNSSAANQRHDSAASNSLMSHHHHSSSNLLAPVDLKSKEALSNYFGLAPATSVGRLLNNSVPDHTPHLNSAITTPSKVSVSNAQTGTIAIHHLPNSFESAKSADLLNNAAKQNGESLDLASNRDSLVWNAANVQIKLGNQSVTIANGEHITPAELIAADQVVNGGQQTLVLTASGVAVAGVFAISPTTLTTYNLLTIPKGVTLDLVGFSAKNELVTGLLRDNGTINVSGGNKSVSVIDARTLIVGSGGIISDSGILDINTSKLFSNNGTISSAVLNLNSASGAFNNGGTLQATYGNVTFDTGVNTNLILNNTNGHVIAADSINFRDASYNFASLNTANTTVAGGDLLATNTLNFNGSQGIVSANVNNITGTVNTTAAQAHVITNTSLLALGTTNITGDPTFYNTGGDIDVSGLGAFPGQALAIVASGSIGDNSNTALNTSSATGNGGAITLIAGAQFTSSGASSGSPAANGTTLTITGANATGGNIFVGDINTSSSNGAGGAVTIVAFAGTQSGAGGGNVGFSSITAGGSGSNANGNVTIIAGATQGIGGVSIGLNGDTSINATGGTGGGGNVSVSTATPQIVGGAVVINSSGVIISGSFAPGTLQQVPTVNNANNGASFTVNASGDVTLNTSTVLSGTIVAGGNVNFNTNVVNTGSFTYSGSISAGGGAGQININASGVNPANSDFNGNVISIFGPILASVVNISVPTNTLDSQSQYDLGLQTNSNVNSNLLNQGVFVNAAQIDNLNVTAATPLQEYYRLPQTAGTMSIDLGGTAASGFSGQGLSLAPVVDITINSAWLNASGGANGPYLLGVPHSLYTLAQNVSTPGTAIVDAASCVTLNLNGFTVTYNNVSSPIVTNGTFSQGSGTNVPGWNITGAPSAVLAANTFYMPGGSNQVLLLNNYSTTQTVVSNAITTTETGHLYTAEITPANPNTNSTVTLSVIDANTGAVLGTSSSPAANRGFSAVVTFTANGDPVKLQVTVTPPSGQSDSVALGYTTVTPSLDYGVMATNIYSGQLPNAQNLSTNVLNAYSKAAFFTLENGSITQGGNGFGSTPLFFESLLGNATVKNVSVTARGDNTTSLDAYALRGNLTVTNSTFTDHITWVPDRMEGVAQISAISITGMTTIENNQLIGSPQSGITVALNNPLYPVYIENNYISQSGVVSDAYGIGTESVQNFIISGNTIEPTVGRGIILDGYFNNPTVNGQIFNNYVIAQDAPNNETQTGIITYAFRMRNDDNNGPPESAFTNINIHDNTFIAIAGPVLGSTSAQAMAISLLNDSGEMNNSGIVINHNTIEAVVQSAASGYSAIGLEIETAGGVNPVVSNNTISSNNIGVGLNIDYQLSAVSGITFLSNAFSVATDHGAATLPYTAIAMATQDNTTTVNNVSFTNSTFINGATPTVNIWGPGPNSISIGQLLNVVAQDQSGNPLSGVAVTISNGSGTEFTGTTGANGQIDSIALTTTSFSQQATAPEATSNINIFTNAVSTNTPNSVVTATSSNPYTVVASYQGQQLTQITTLTASSVATDTFKFAGIAPVTLHSLDLTNATVKTDIATLIANGTPGISGSATALVLNSSVSSSLVTLGSLSSLDIPQGDSITFTGFTNSSPIISVNLTSGSSTTQALINGTLSFTNSNASVGQLTISSTQTGPALVIGSTGILSSDHQLIVIAPTIQNNGVVSASNSLSASSNAGSITGSGSFKSPTVNLAAVGGNIGADVGATTALLVNSGGTGGINLSTVGNAINLSDTSAEAVNLGTNTANANFTLGAHGNVTVGNSVGSSSCTAVSLTTTGANFIEDAGSGSYGVTGSSVVLSTASGQIGTPGFRVNCTSLAVNTTGNVHVSNSGTATLAINASSGNSLAITSNGTMDINGNVTGSTSVTLQTAAGSNGNIIIAANVGTYGANTTTTLVTDGSGKIADAGPGTNVVQAHLLNIASTTGNIGSPGLRTIADEINCTTGGNVHLNNIGTGPVTFLSVTGGGSFFQVLANSTITVTQPIFAPNTMLLSVVSGNGSIIINGPVGTTSSSTSVSVEGTGSITTGTGGVIFGSTVIVNNPFGNIGSSTTPLSIAGNNVSVNAVTGLVNVANNIGGAVTLGNVPGNVVGAGKSFAFSTTGTGPLTVYSVTSGNGNLSIVNNVGGMSVAAGATLSSTNGNITLQDTDTVNGSIAFGANVTVHASATADGVGKVYAVIGAIPNNPVVGNKPAHVTVNNTDGGITYFGTNSITATGSNTLNASGRNIVFNTGLLPASTISLGGGVTITADPPVVSNGSAAISITSSPEPNNSLSNNFATIPFTVDGQSQSTANNFATATNTSVQALINTTGADSPDRRLNRTTTVEN